MSASKRFNDYLELVKVDLDGTRLNLLSSASQAQTQILNPALNYAKLHPLYFTFFCLFSLLSLLPLLTFILFAVSITLIITIASITFTSFWITLLVGTAALVLGLTLIVILGISFTLSSAVVALYLVYRFLVNLRTASTPIKGLEEFDRELRDLVFGSQSDASNTGPRQGLFFAEASSLSEDVKPKVIAA